MKSLNFRISHARPQSKTHDGLESDPGSKQRSKKTQKRDKQKEMRRSKEAENKVDFLEGQKLCFKKHDLTKIFIN